MDTDWHPHWTYVRGGRGAMGRFSGQRPMQLPGIPVRHNGLVVFHTPEQYAALWQGVEPEACEGMAADLDAFLDAENCACEGGCECG